MASNFHNTNDKYREVTVQVFLVRELAASLLCAPSASYLDNQMFTLPKSQIDWSGTPGTNIMVTMPQWLATNEGLG